MTDADGSNWPPEPYIDDRVLALVCPHCGSDDLRTIEIGYAWGDVEFTVENGERAIDWSSSSGIRDPDWVTEGVICPVCLWSLRYKQLPGAGGKEASDGDLLAWLPTAEEFEHSLWLLKGLVRLDLLLVDGTLYGVGVEWSKLDYVSPGSASIYPYKVKLSNGTVGQFKLDEILAWARTIETHRTIMAMEKSHPGFLADLEAASRWPR